MNESKTRLDLPLLLISVGTVLALVVLMTVFPEGTLYHYVGEKTPLVEKLKSELQKADQILIKSSFGTDLLAVVAALRV